MTPDQIFALVKNPRNWRRNVGGDGRVSWLGAEQGSPQERFFHAVFAPVASSGRLKAVADNPQLLSHNYFSELEGFNGAHLFGGRFALYGLHYYGRPIDFFPAPFDLIIENINRSEVRNLIHEGLIIGSSKLRGNFIHFVEDSSGVIYEVEHDGGIISKNELNLKEFLELKINDVPDMI